MELGVAAVALVGLCMALWSLLLVLLPAPYFETQDRLLWIVNTDMFAIQNLGHGAFLAMFATSWWRNQNVLGLAMCQLSCVFLLFSVAGYSALAVRFCNKVRWMHHVVPWVFLLVLAVATQSCKSMAAKWNLDIFSWRVFWIKDEDLVVRRFLLFLCVLHCLEPILVATARLLSAKDFHLESDLENFPALTLRAFIESYTLGFHQAFVLATAFAQLMVEDRIKVPSAVLLAIFGQFSLVLAFAVGGVMIPSDDAFVGMTLAKVILHLAAGFLLIPTFLRAKRVRGNMEGYQAVPKGGSVGSHESDEIYEDGNREAPSPDSQFHGFTLWSAYAENPSALTLAIFIFAAFHGICWQLQAILSVYLSFTSSSEMDQANGLQAGLNFGMHGAGITIFVYVLALRSPFSFPFLKMAVVAGCFGGAAMSAVQLIQLSEFQGSTANAILVQRFFSLRGLAGVLLGVTYASLRFPESIEAAKLKVGEPGRSKTRAHILMCIFWGSVIFYAAFVNHRLAEAGVRAGFSVDASNDSTKVDRWHAHRLIEFPPGYGIVFHFSFLLLGFVGHYFGVEFMPSKWISVVFLLSVVVIMFSELVLIKILEPAGVEGLFNTAVGFPMVAGIFLVLETLFYRPSHSKNVEFLAADFWH